MQTVVDWSQKRQRHVLERMLLRGISRREFHAALAKGAKRRKEPVIEAAYRYYSVVYEERVDRRHRYRKVYPITVKVIR